MVVGKLQNSFSFSWEECTGDRIELERIMQLSVSEKMEEVLNHRNSLLIFNLYVQTTFFMQLNHVHICYAFKYKLITRYCHFVIYIRISEVNMPGIK